MCLNSKTHTKEGLALVNNTELVHVDYLTKWNKVWLLLLFYFFILNILITNSKLGGKACLVDYLRFWLYWCAIVGQCFSLFIYEWNVIIVFCVNWCSFTILVLVLYKIFAFTYQEVCDMKSFTLLKSYNLAMIICSRSCIIWLL